MTEARARPLILVVDDEFAMRLLASETLLGADFDVLEAENGEEAIAQFRTHAPDAVVLDVMMEGMDGYEACRRMRSDGGEHTPILMMTGRDDVEAIDAAYHAGATDFIAKPIPYTLLGHRMRYLLRAASSFRHEREVSHRLSTAQRLARLVQWEHELPNGAFRWSEEVQAVFGITDETHTVAEGLSRWVHEGDRARVEEAVCSAQSHQLDYRMTLPDGRERLIHQEAELVVCARTGAPRLVGAAQDVTERREAERRADHLTYNDGLTGIPNRTHLRATLARALARAEQSGETVALLAFDLDRLRVVNDSLGPAAGDAALIETARRLTEVVEGLHTAHSASAQHGGLASSAGLVARLDGDTFAILLPTLSDRLEARSVAEAALEALRPALEFDGAEISLAGNFGVATFPDDGRSAAELFKHADAALSHAKATKVGTVELFSDALRRATERKLMIEHGLSLSLSGPGDEHGGTLELHFQPKVSLPSSRCASVEALLRWRSAHLGPVSPLEFIAVAEESNLIVELGAWVLETACTVATRELRDVVVAVNISPKQFLSTGFVELVGETLARTRLEAERLILEITEGVVMQDVARSQRVLSELKTLGVHIALDDFGTGYSSLGYLTRFPIDELKIDRSFVKELPCARNESIVTAIVAMASSLGIDVVVEGVETDAQLDFFRTLGPLEIQGYYFSKPLPKELLRVWLDERARVSERDDLERHVAVVDDRAAV